MVKCPKGYESRCVKIRKKQRKPKLDKIKLTKLVTNLDPVDQKRLSKINDKLLKDKGELIKQRNEIKKEKESISELLNRALNKPSIGSNMERIRKILREKSGLHEDVIKHVLLPRSEAELTQERKKEIESEIKSIEKRIKEEDDPQELIDLHKVIDVLEESTKPSKETEEQKGEGGMYTDEIEEVMKTVPNFKGVVSSDQLDSLPVSENFSFIYNTDTSNNQGKHWIACRIDSHDKSVEIFDPLANPTQPIIKKGLQKIMNKLKPLEMYKLKENSVKNQRDDTDSCGWQCIRFLKDRSKGRSYKESTHYTECQQDKTAIGEKEAQQVKEKFGFI